MTLDIHSYPIEPSSRNFRGLPLGGWTLNPTDVTGPFTSQKKQGPSPPKSEHETNKKEQKAKISLPLLAFPIEVGWLGREYPSLPSNMALQCKPYWAICSQFV